MALGILRAAVSAIGSFIGGAAAKVGSFITGFATKALGFLGKLKIPEGVFKTVSTVSDIVHSVTGILGIKSEEDPVYLGARAEQYGKGPDDCESTEEYIRDLREKVKLDKEKIDKLSQEEKAGYKLMGTAIETRAISEKLGGVNIPESSLGTVAKLEFGGAKIDPKQLAAVLLNLKEQGITDLDDVVHYLEGTGSRNMKEVGEALASALGEDADNKISAMKAAIRSFEEV